MNLAIIIRGILPEKIGGQEIYGFIILKNLIQTKCRVVVYTLGISKIVKKNYKIFSFKPLNFYFFRFPFKTLMYILSFLKHQKQSKIQIIHANGVISEGLAAILIKKILKIPVLITLHGGGIYSFANRFPFIVKFILKHSDRIIAINKFLQIKAKQYTTNRIDLIPNFIDSNKFRRKNKQSIIDFKKKYDLNDKIIILIVSRLVTTKGIDNLILAIRELVKSYPNICLQIIGEGPQKKKLIKFANKHGLKDKVFFLGKISNDKLPIYYSACDVFVLPSLYEGQPTVLLEAMACEAPIIATAVGGVKELIKHKFNGLLIPKNDYLTLSKNINRLISNPDLKTRMGKNGRQIIEDQYESTKNFKKIYEIYLSIIQQFQLER
ncbi:MAG: glycosyltransferase family 4 protein [Promethearchaeota archaeon]